MAHDEGLAEILRSDLTDIPGITEKRMFGGLAFMRDGNMICGVYPDSNEAAAMFRVGKAHMDAALALPGVDPMGFTGRPMGGIVDVASDSFADDDLRAQLLTLALNFTATLPPK